MNKNFLQILAALIFFIWAKWFAGEEIRPELYGMSIGMAAALLIGMINFLYNERKYLRLYINTFLLKPNSEIRMSVAYLYKIECKGKYLLVKNSRFDKVTYQPVGGVYKYFHPEAAKKLSCMSIITDNAIDNDSKSEHDLRLKMSKRKYLRQFIKWFFSSEDRETDPWREFYEELIRTKILSSVHFKYIYFHLVGQHFEPIHNDSYYKVDTFKYVDVFTPRFINQKQIDEIEKLQSVKSDDFIWATEEEIKKKVNKDGKRISDHAYKMFFTKKIMK
jgi:hypothetical protein